MDTIKATVRIFHENFVFQLIHAFYQLLQQSVKLRLVSLDIDPNTNEEKVSSASTLSLFGGTVDNIDMFLTTSFSVGADFGRPGAILLESYDNNEFYMKSITLEMPDNTQIYFPCHTWINHLKLNSGQPRIFFTSHPYLPRETPPTLLKYRQNELVSLRGDDMAERVYGERKYGFDVYNDIGNPDQDLKLKRPVLGGSDEYPYPRRCRTGRKHTKKDKDSEKPVTGFDTGYLPRDERFSRYKKMLFVTAGIRCLTHHFIFSIQSIILRDHIFEEQEDIHKLYVGQLKHDFKSTKQIVRKPTDGTLMEFPPPGIVQANPKAWKSDEEFGRQRLAGANPLVIQRLETFPPVSSLDPDLYGDPKSSITESHLQPLLEGFSVKEALEHNLLYMLDYHDALMPYINRINKQEGKTYASRTILYLTKSGKLLPIVIELTLPPQAKGENAISRVFTSLHSECLWHMAKTHVAVVDAGYHQVASHWLRTHACIEPIRIATVRQISIVHPIHKLLLPHFKDTLHVNAFARSSLVNAGGKIETHYTTGEYSMEISSAVYKSWRFDKEGLPEDLLKRGMAIKDPSAKHGLRLTIEDYPYAVDGLDLWAAIRKWVEEYVNLYYRDDEDVVKDEELQTWWLEVRTRGHADHANASWWPTMTSVENLIQIGCTIIWLASAHHAAVNFGQYAYAGYMPNSPCMARKFIPEEGTPEYHEMVSDPDKFYLNTIPQYRATTLAMAVLEILAQHMNDEIYLGEQSDSQWTTDKRAISVFENFRENLAQVEASIEARNLEAEEDPQKSKLYHRVGSVLLPYTLLAPSGSAGPGLTFRGVPNSISI